MATSPFGTAEEHAAALAEVRSAAKAYYWGPAPKPAVLDEVGVQHEPVGGVARRARVTPLGLRLDVRVAVRLDSEMLLASVGQDLSEWGRECRAQGRVRDLEEEDGGACAVIADPDRGLLGVWVGVVNGVLTGECDCVDGVPGRLCGHAVAVALTALEKKFTFSSISSRARGVDPEEQRFAEIAAGLTPRALIGLVARQAVADRHFAALLLASAARLPPPGPKEIHAARRVIHGSVGVRGSSLSVQCHLA